MIKAIKALHNLERTQRVPLRYILGLPNETNSTMIYRESGILPLRLLIKKETATYLLRAAKPIQTDIIQRVQEETQKDPRVFNDTSWSIKAAWLQKEIGIPPIIPQCSTNVIMVRTTHTSNHTESHPEESLSRRRSNRSN